MSLSANLQNAAHALQQARAPRALIAPIAPIPTTFGIERLDDACAIAEFITRERLAQGRRILGLKAGQVILSGALGRVACRLA